MTKNYHGSNEITTSGHTAHPKLASFQIVCVPIRTMRVFVSRTWVSAKLNFI